MVKKMLKPIFILFLIWNVSSIVFGGHTQPTPTPTHTPTPTTTPTPTPTPTPTATPDCDDCQSKEDVYILCEGCYLPDPYSPFVIFPCELDYCGEFEGCVAELLTWCEDGNGNPYNICCDEFEVFLDIVDRCYFVPPGPNEPYCHCVFTYEEAWYPTVINMCI